MDKKEEINSLYKLLYEKDREFEKAKGKRAVITILCFAAFFFWLSVATGGMPTGIDILYITVGSIVLAGICFFVGAAIFGYLANKGRDEADALERIRKRIRELEK